MPKIQWWLNPFHAILDPHRKSEGVQNHTLTPLAKAGMLAPHPEGNGGLGVVRPTPFHCRYMFSISVPLIARTFSYNHTLIPRPLLRGILDPSLLVLHAKNVELQLLVCIYIYYCTVPHFIRTSQTCELDLRYQVKYVLGEQTAWRHLWAHDRKQTGLRAHAVKGSFTSSKSVIFTACKTKLWEGAILHMSVRGIPQQRRYPGFSQGGGHANSPWEGGGGANTRFSRKLHLKSKEFGCPEGGGGGRGVCPSRSPP